MKQTITYDLVVAPILIGCLMITILVSTPMVDATSIQNSNNQDSWPRNSSSNGTFVLQSYIDELDNKYELILNHDESVEQRHGRLFEAGRMTEAFNTNFDEFNSGDIREDDLNERLVAGPNTDDALCGQHLDAMLGLMDEMQQIIDANTNTSTGKFQDRHLRMARVLDSFGHYESAFMSPRLLLFGAHEQCLNTRMELLDNRTALGSNQTSLVGTRYCWARLQVSPDNQTDLSSQTFLRMAICIPDSCRTKSLNVLYRHKLQKLLDSQFRLPAPIYMHQTGKLQSVFCTVDENSQLEIPAIGKLLLLLLTVWSCLVIYASFRMKSDEESDCESSHTNPLECLDIRTSWAEFVGRQEDWKQKLISPRINRRVDLNTLNPIRWIGCTLVVCGHLTGDRLSYGIDPVAYLNQLQSSLFGTLPFFGVMAVDTFFVISGMLMTFVVRKKIDKLHDRKASSDNSEEGKMSKQRQSPAQALLVGSYEIIKSRYLRLMPLLALVYWFKRSVFIYMGTGPMWDYGFNKDTSFGACIRESWLGPFVFTSAFLPMTKEGKMSKQRQSPAQALLVGSYEIIKSRYLRLMPLLALVYWFKRSVLIYLGSGPIWDYGFNKDTSFGACIRESWLGPFVFTSAFLPMTKQCLVQTWTVSNDMLFLVMFVPIILISTRKPYLATSIAGCLCLLSNYLVLAELDRLESIPSMAANVLAMKDMLVHAPGSMIAHWSHVWTYPTYRISSFAIGVLGGHFLFLYDKGETLKQWPRWFKGWATNLSLGNLLIQSILVSNGGLVRRCFDPYHRLIFPFSLTLGKGLWAASNMVLFLRMMTDWKDNYLMRASASRFWQITSKLNYAMLLVHFDILHYDILALPETNFVNNWRFFESFSTAYLASIAISIVLYVAFENPMDKIIKRLRI